MSPIKIITVVTAIAVAGCVQSGLDAPATLAELDEAYFACHVERALVSGCGALVCHGSDERAFRVYGRGRLRMPGEAVIGAKTPLTERERRANFDAARAFTDPGGESMLLLKPLDSDAGGYFHRGKDLFGYEDVYVSTDDADYRVLAEWIGGATESVYCPQPELP